MPTSRGAPGTYQPPVVPNGFEIPKGVRITDGGATRQLGKAATVIYQIEQRAASAVTVTVTEVVVGDLPGCSPDRTSEGNLP